MKCEYPECEKMATELAFGRLEGFRKTKNIATFILKLSGTKTILSMSFLVLTALAGLELIK